MGFIRDSIIEKHWNRVLGECLSMEYTSPVEPEHALAKQEELVACSLARIKDYKYDDWEPL